MSENYTNSDSENASEVHEVFLTRSNEMSKKKILMKNKKQRHFFPLGIYYINAKDKNL